MPRQTGRVHVYAEKLRRKPSIVVFVVGHETEIAPLLEMSL